MIDISEDMGSASVQTTGNTIFITIVSILILLILLVVFSSSTYSKNKEITSLNAQVVDLTTSRAVIETELKYVRARYIKDTANVYNLKTNNAQLKKSNDMLFARVQNVEYYFQNNPIKRHLDTMEQAIASIRGEFHKPAFVKPGYPKQPSEQVYTPQSYDSETQKRTYTPYKSKYDRLLCPKCGATVVGNIRNASRICHSCDAHMILQKGATTKELQQSYIHKVKKYYYTLVCPKCEATTSGPFKQNDTRACFSCTGTMTAQGKYYNVPETEGERAERINKNELRLMEINDAFNRLNDDNIINPDILNAMRTRQMKLIDKYLVR